MNNSSFDLPYKKYISLFFILSLVGLTTLFQSSCSRNFTSTQSVLENPTSFVTKTSINTTLSTPTFTLSVTQTASPTFKSVYISTLATAIPVTEQQTYRLKKWEETDAMQAIEEAEQIAKGDFGINANYSMTLIEEARTRFPSLYKSREMASKLLYWVGSSDPRSSFSNRRLSTAFFSSLFEEAINKGEVNLATAENWFTDHGYLMFERIKVPRITEDGQPGEIFYLSNSALAQGSFVLLGSIPGQYHVIPISNYWLDDAPAMGNDFLFSVLDLNNNQQSEIGLVEEWESSGLPYACGVNFRLLEWNDSQFHDLVDIPEVRFSSDEGTCKGAFTFLPQPDGTKRIVRNEIHLVGHTPPGES